MVQIDPWVYPLWALLLLAVPVDWLIAASLAALIHELGHVGMILLLGQEIRGVQIRPGGAQIMTSPMDFRQELLCALAGPAASFSLVLLCKWAPRTAICAAGQGLFNMLPIYPLDGGRALQCALVLLFPDWGKKRKKPCKP